MGKRDKQLIELGPEEGEGRRGKGLTSFVHRQYRPDQRREKTQRMTTNSMAACDKRVHVYIGGNKKRKRGTQFSGVKAGAPLG